VDLKQVRQALETVERTQADEAAQTDARIAELSKRLTGTKEALEASQALAERERQEKEKFKQQLADFEAEFVTKTTNVEARIATLRAEQEVLARRDRESRNELDRLQHMKNGKK
jgi:chromosome segregation ATPase